MADACELAHKLTVRECFHRGIDVDQYADNGDINYTDKAQDIFNDYYDIVTTELSV